jgi:hypothetical protein
MIFYIDVIGYRPMEVVKPKLNQKSAATIILKLTSVTYITYKKRHYDPKKPTSKHHIMPFPF